MFLGYISRNCVSFITETNTFLKQKKYPNNVMFREEWEK